MIEKKFVQEKLKEFAIEEFVASKLKNVGHSKTRVKRIPLGEKIIITASRPGLVVGRKGENIRALTEELKTKFDLSNPQIEIEEIEKPNLDPNIIAERIVSSLERFGTAMFKGIGHKMMANVMDSGAYGVEILISGKIPGSRAKRWRFYTGYLKKCGDIAISGVKKSILFAKLKTGVIGVQVKIMPPDVVLPDNMEILKEPKQVVEEIVAEETVKGKKKSVKKKKSTKDKKSAKDKPKKSKEPKEPKESKEPKDEVSEEAEKKE